MQQSTHKEQLQAQFNYNKMQVLWLTKMNEEQLNGFVIDTGRAFIEHNYIAQQIEAVTNNAKFWNWWRYQWQLVDDAWCIKELYSIKDDARLVTYRLMHQFVFDRTDTNNQLLMKDFYNYKASFAQPIIYNAEGEE